MFAGGQLCNNFERESAIYITIQCEKQEKFRLGICLN